MSLTVNTLLQDVVYNKVFAKSEQEIFKQFDSIGKRNAVLQDAQTYSFRHRRYIHTSSVKIAGNRRVPMLHKDLEEEFLKVYNTYLNLESMYDKTFSMLNYIKLHHHTDVLFERLPSFLKEAQTALRVLGFNYTARGYDEETLNQIVKTFDDCYEQTLNDLYDTMMMNSLTE